MAGSTLDRPYLDREWLRAHLARERAEADLLGEIREAVFGAQDGVTSILAVVATVAVATTNTYAVLIAGIAAALAEIFSMAAGEYMSSKSQREIFDAQIEMERSEVHERPGEAEAEVAYMLEHEGLSQAAAARVVAELAQQPKVLLKTMVEKELGLSFHEGGSPLQGALILAVAFAVASLVPLLPFFFFDVHTGLWVSIGLSMVAVFVLGVVKSRWTARNPITSGLEIVLLVAGAAVAGFVFGSILPRLLGVAGITG